MLTNVNENTLFSNALKYKEKYNQQWIIIKYGGALAADPDIVQNIGLQAAFLQTAIGAKIIIVHGGGEQVSTALKEQGIPAIFDPSTGRRVTDEATLQIFDRTLRTLNKANVNIMQSASQEVLFQGMAGYDLNTVMATSIGDYTGKVTQINKPFFDNTPEDTIPVFYTACRNASPNTAEHRLNINADEFSGMLGQQLKAVSLIMLTDTNGVLDKNKNLLSTIFTEQTEPLIADGTVKGGMIPKLRVATECAQQMNSGSVVILNGTDRFSILKELFSEQKSGTVVRLQNQISTSQSFNAEAAPTSSDEAISNCNLDMKGAFL